MVCVPISDIPVLIISALIGVPIISVLVPFWIGKKLNPEWLLIVMVGLIWLSSTLAQFIWNRIKQGWANREPGISKNISSGRAAACSTIKTHWPTLGSAGHLMV